MEIVRAPVVCVLGRQKTHWTGVKQYWTPLEAMPHVGLRNSNSTANVTMQTKTRAGVDFTASFTRPVSTCCVCVTTGSTKFTHRCLAGFFSMSEVTATIASISSAVISGMAVPIAALASHISKATFCHMTKLATILTGLRFPALTCRVTIPIANSAAARLHSTRLVLALEERLFNGVATLLAIELVANCVESKHTMWTKTRSFGHSLQKYVTLLRFGYRNNESANSVFGNPKAEIRHCFRSKFTAPS